MRIRRGHGISQCNRGSGQSDSERHFATEGHPRHGSARIDEDVLLLHAHVTLPEGHRRVRAVHHARGDGPVASSEHGVPRGRALDEHADQRFHGSAGDRRGRRPEDQTDYLAFIERMIGHYRKVHGQKFKLFALDSLGALYSLMENTNNMRKRLFYFFKMLRDNELTSLVVMERTPNGESQLLGNEGFLVDGIVMLGLDRSRGKLVRYLQVEKMRSVEHSMEKHAIEIRKGGITVMGPIFEAGGNS